jgi:hypothetical protein
MTSSTDNNNFYTYSYSSGQYEYNGVKSGLYYIYNGNVNGYLNHLRKKHGFLLCHLHDINTPLDLNSVSYFDPRRNRYVEKTNNEKYASLTYYYYDEKDNIIRVINTTSERHIKFKTFKKNFKVIGEDVSEQYLKREVRKAKIKSLDL